MQGEWACGECAAENDGSASACRSCGAGRDSRAAQQGATLAWIPAPAGPEPSSTGTASSPRTARRVGAAALVAVVVIVAAAGWFAATRGSSAPAASAVPAVADIPVGTCYNQPTAAPGAAGGYVTTVPCAISHTYEMFYTGALPDLGGAPRAGDLLSWIHDNCDPAFASYVGVPVSQSRLDEYLQFPSDESWAAGDRAATCSLGSKDHAPITGSMQGARQ